MPVVEQQHNHRAIWAWAGVILVCVACAAISWTVYRDRERANQEAALQGQLMTEANGVDFQKIASLATQLIDRQKAGTYKIANKTLAMDYIERATARVNLQQYQSAAQDYQKAIQLDATDDQEAALQGEVSADYRAGERQQLVPLLQQLVTISSAKGHDPLGGTPQQYESEIHAIQLNEPTSL